MGTVSKGGGEGEPYLSAALQYTAKPLKVDACWQSDGQYVWLWKCVEWNIIMRAG